MDKPQDTNHTDENLAQFADLQIWPVGEEIARIEEQLLEESDQLTDMEIPWLV